VGAGLFRACFAGPFRISGVRTVKQRIAEPDQGSAGMAGLRQLAQRSERGNRWKHGECMGPHEPGQAAEILPSSLLRLLGNEDLEGELCKRARRYNEKMLAFDYVLYLSKQCLVERVSASRIEG